MRGWLLIAVLVLAGCHGRRTPNTPGTNVGSNGQPQPVGGPWTQGGPALQGP